VSNFLESIPEWSEFYNTVLVPVNTIENKPLGSDPRKKHKNDAHSDDYFDLICKLKDVNRSGFQNKSKKNNEGSDVKYGDDEDNEEEVEVEETDDFNRDNDDETNQRDEEENNLFQTISRKKSRNSAA
jgi:hypothetical protein